MLNESDNLPSPKLKSLHPQVYEFEYAVIGTAEPQLKGSKQNVKGYI